MRKSSRNPSRRSLLTVKSKYHLCFSATLYLICVHCRCIDQLGSFVAPILAGIEELTGFKTVLLAGGPIPRYGGEIGAIQ
jgi:hypothetical protein